MVNVSNFLDNSHRRGSRVARVVIIAVVAGIVALSGCRRGDDHGTAQAEAIESKSAAKEDPSPVHQQESEQARPLGASKQGGNRLDSLGYLDHAEEEVDPDEGHGVVLIDEQRSYPGYNLYCSIPDSLAELIDANGRIVNSWKYKSSTKWVRCELLPNGDLLVVSTGRKSRGVFRLSWESELIWKHRTSAHHDIEVTPRDQIIVLTANQRIVPAVDPVRDIRDHLLTILSQDGSVLEEYSVYDLLSSDPKIFSFQSVVEEGKNRKRHPIDLLHVNSVEWMHLPHLESKDPIYASSNVIISSRKQDTIAIINWDEKKLVWAWGQGELSGQHEANVLENGNILVFDNGVARSWSRVIEMDPLSREIVWEYRAPNPDDFHCPGRGVSQRLSNGNTLIVDSITGEAFEVTRDGDQVWRFLNPHMSKSRHRGIIRLKRYELSYVQRILELFSGEKS